MDANETCYCVWRAYVGYFTKQPDTRCIAVVRTPDPEIATETITADLLDADRVSQEIGSIDLSEIDEVTLIHPVGRFKFEENGTPEIDEDGDGVDDEIYASNIDTFMNIVRPLRARIEKEGRPIDLILSAFGSIGDAYVFKYWQSYSRAKNILRERMRALAAQPGVRVRSVFFSVSTMDTGNERKLRPFADRGSWLSPKEVVERSIPALNGSERWVDVWIDTLRPHFDAAYYSNPQRIRAKWSREMGRDLSE